MREKVLIILLIFNLGLMISFNRKLEVLELQMDKLSIKRMSKAEEQLKTKVIAKDLKVKAKAVLSIRCQDSSQPPEGATKEEKKTYPKKWQGTASKVGKNLILTADHLISNNGDETNRVFPVECKFYQRGKEVATFNSAKQKFKQIGLQDIALIEAVFTDYGKQIDPIPPEVFSGISVGENLVLVTHPKQIINDYLITFGMVLNDDTENVLAESRKEYWKHSIITDMTAAPGSSGSPLFTIDGRFIGIHVGGDRDGIQANYQIVFSTDFYIQYKMLTLLNWK